MAKKDQIQTPPTTPQSASPSPDVQDLKKPEAKADGAKVKIKMLRQVGPYAAGQEVEVDQELADQLCAPSIQQHAGSLQNLQKAVLMSDVDKLKNGEIDISGLTQAEMDEAGLKNVIPSPYESHPPEVAVEIGEKADKIKEQYANQK